MPLHFQICIFRRERTVTRPGKLPETDDLRGLDFLRLINLDVIHGRGVYDRLACQAIELSV